MNNDNGRVFTPLMIQLLIQELFAGQKAKHSNRVAEGMLNVTELLIQLYQNHNLFLINS